MNPRFLMRFPMRLLLPALVPPLLPLLGVLAATCAHADSKRLQPAVVLPAYQAECAACHLAYPPGFLPAASWSRVMTQLDRHYGSDASLDAATVAQVSQWLQTHAGTYKRVTATPPPEDRITRSDWFLRKHRKIDTPQVWQHTAVKSAANCAACHSQAEQGRFSDGGLVFPKGLPERYRTAFMDN
jgi:mono/diheme cytochrome c family protein